MIVDGATRGAVDPVVRDGVHDSHDLGRAALDTPPCVHPLTEDFALRKEVFDERLIHDDDWLEQDPDSRRRPVPHRVHRLRRARYLTVAGVVGPGPEHPLADVLGDALVTPSSASGRSDHPDDVDLFSVALEAGKNYDLAVHGFGQFRLVLVDVDGKTVLAKNAKAIKHRPANPGLHYVRVENAGAQPQDYALEVLKTK